MSLRITNQMVSRSVLQDINDISRRLSSTQQKLSSGKEITRPSDDPYGTSRALTLRGDVAAAQQYQRNEAVKGEANASYGGRYVLSGTLTGTRPYSVGAVDTYAGDNAAIAREIG